MAGLTAGERGHEVTIYEKERESGGQINLARLGAGRSNLGGVSRYLKRRIDQKGISLITGVEVTPELVREQAPDVVIVAAGSRPDSRPFPGTYGPPSVLSVWDVLAETYPVGARVLYIDETGGHRAAGTVTSATA